MAIGNCDACKINNITIEMLRIDGIDVNVCINWKACIKRFNKKGN